MNLFCPLCGGGHAPCRPVAAGYCLRRVCRAAQYAPFLIFLFLTALLAASCGEKEPTFRIGVSQCSNDAWRRQMNHELHREATFHKNAVKLDIRSAADDNGRQIRQIDSMVAEGIDLLVVAPNEAQPLTPVVERVMKQGIPVVVIDRKIKSDNYTAFVGADNAAIGRDIGAYVVNELHGRGKVAEFTGGMAGTAAAERHKGFHEVLNQAPGIKVTAQVEMGWEGPRLKQQVDSLVRSGQIPDLILAPNDRTGVRIHHELLAQGCKGVKIIGVDGLAGTGGGLENVERGELLATFIYPTGGDRILQTALHILKGEPYARETMLRSAIINATTSRIFRIQADELKESEAHVNEMGVELEEYFSRYAMQNMLLAACLVIIVLIGLLLGIGIRYYHMALRRSETLARQKQKLESQRDQLMEMSREVERTTQGKLQFFTSVSHDFRTPLTLIKAPLEQLNASDNLTREQRELLALVGGNVNVLLRLVNQTLDFSKYDVGKLRLNLQQLTLADAVEQWTEPFKPLARKKMIRFRVDCEFAMTDAGVTVHADAHRMESVVYNLLSNAMKYTPHGGRVTVKVYLTTDSSQRRCYCIDVENTGQGIEPEKLVHIFERFYQTDVTHEGSGLGLATVKNFVELHGGTVRAESRVGMSTRFVVTVPCEPPVQEQDTEIADATAAGRTAHNEAAEPSQTVGVVPMEKEASEGAPLVLVIDDNEDIRSYLKLLLAPDYAVAEAANGSEGLDMAARLQPSLVICDVMMPVMDGWTCCRELKQREETAHIPVLMLTACALDEQHVQGFDSGADGYVTKPFSADLLRSRVRSLLDNRQRVKDFFAGSGTLVKPEASEADMGFAERFKALVAKRLSDANLSVDELAQEMGLGRTQLYRKVKSLTGFSPNELLKIARLKRAAHLLRQSDKNVSEVAYEVGFGSPSYLTKCFKDYFGVSPSDYGK